MRWLKEVSDRAEDRLEGENRKEEDRGRQPSTWVVDQKKDSPEGETRRRLRGERQREREREGGRERES